MKKQNQPSMNRWIWIGLGSIFLLFIVVQIASLTFDKNKFQLGEKIGIITFISPTAEISTRTFEFTIEADNKDLSYKSGNELKQVGFRYSMVVKLKFESKKSLDYLRSLPAGPYGSQSSNADEEIKSGVDSGYGGSLKRKREVKRPRRLGAATTRLVLSSAHWSSTNFSGAMNLQLKTSPRATLNVVVADAASIRATMPAH